MAQLLPYAEVHMLRGGCCFGSHFKAEYVGVTFCDWVVKMCFGLGHNLGAGVREIWEEIWQRGKFGRGRRGKGGWEPQKR
jgi:hypothetical protein